MQNIKPDTLIKKLLFVVYFIAIVVSGYSTLKKQLYNEDILTYMNMVLSFDNARTVSTIPIADSITMMEVPAKRAQQLVTRYQEILQRQDAKVVISFAILKPFYVGLVYFFYKWGIKLTVATVLPSILGYIAIGLLLYSWLKIYFRLIPAFLISLIIMQWDVVINTARLSSPDCLSAFFIFSAMFCVIELKDMNKVFIMLVLAILTRLDNCIFSFLLLTMLLITKSEIRMSIKQYIIYIAGLITACFIVMFIARVFGWDLMFFSSYTKNLTYNVDKTVFSVEVYRRTLSQTLDYTIRKTVILYFLGLSAIVFLTKKGKWTVEQWFTVLILFLFIVRYIMYPFTHNRFYLGYYMVFIVFFANALQSYNRKHFNINEIKL